MSQERTERPLSNREEIERRLRAACDGLDEPYPGYRDEMFNVALKAIGLVAKHNFEPVSDINVQLRRLLARAGDVAHAKAAESEGVDR